MSSTSDAAAAARYAALQTTRNARIAEILAGELPETYELQRGYPYRCGDPYGDAALWAATKARGLLPHRLPEDVARCLDALGNVFDAPTLEDLKHAVRARPEWSPELRFQMSLLGDRADLYLRTLGDTDAALRVASHAYNNWRGLHERTSPDGFGAIRQTLGHLKAAHGLTWEDPDPMLGDLSAELRMAAAVDTDDVFEAQPPGYDDPGYLDDDRLGIVRLLAPMDGLVVLRSVEHLPGHAENGRKAGIIVGPSPRAEFASLAGVRLPAVREADVAVVAATIRSEWPWASSVVDALLTDLVGQGFFRFQNTLLVGPPGAGKTRLARRIGELLGLHVMVYSAAGVADAAFGGTSRQWSTGRACVPLQAIKQARQANVVVVLDEIEKAGTRKENGRLIDSLIAFLERESASRYHDPYLECPVNLSAVSYLATANSLDGIPDALRDRFRVLQVPEPGPEHLGDLARRIVAELRIERGTDESWMPDLEGDELDLIAARWPGGSLRRLRRLVETVVWGRDALAPRH